MSKKDNKGVMKPIKNRKAMSSEKVVNESNGERSSMKSKGKLNGVTNETMRDIKLKSGTFSKLLVFLLFGCGSLYLLTAYKDGPVSAFIELAVPKEYGEVIIGHINYLVPLVETIKEQVKEHIDSIKEQVKGRVGTFKEQMKEHADAIEEKVNEHVETIKEKVNEDVDTIKEQVKSQIQSSSRIAMGKTPKEKDVEKTMEDQIYKSTEVFVIDSEETKEDKAEVEADKEEKEIAEEKSAGENEEDMADEEAEREVQKRKNYIKEAAQEEEAFKKAKSQMEEAIKESVNWAEREKFKKQQIKM